MTYAHAMKQTDHNKQDTEFRTGNKMNKIDFVSKLKEVLTKGGSLNGNGDLWTQENFNNLKAATLGSPDEDKNKSFSDKIKTQLDGKDPSLHLLMVEILTIYYFIPTSISRSTKSSNINYLISLIPDSQNFDFSFSIECLDFYGIASGGMGYNTNKFREVFYPITVFSKWFDFSETERERLLQETNHAEFQYLIDNLDELEGRTPQSRHALLHLLFSNQYEPIISQGEKTKLVNAFEGLIENSDMIKNADVDQKIRMIKTNLAEIRGKEVNFYDEDLKKFWLQGSSSNKDNPDSSLLEYKKQIVLYGPPGTSKTYRAKELAKEMINHQLAKSLGSHLFKEEGQAKLKIAHENNIHRLQLHPAYSYEDFVRGMHFQGGNTVYKKGYLLNLIDKMKSEPELPHVLILDEINRVDLSRLFGECFSALENRGEAIDLIGNTDTEPMTLTIPANLYVIGTMNLIDHSVEQLDFALRRRFLWIEATYCPEALFDICQNNWTKFAQGKISKEFSAVEDDFIKLVEAANNLNDEISNESELGEDFKLGHVFFIDSVIFLQEALMSQPKKTTYLFRESGWYEPITKLWNYSLEPLLKEYLSGIDKESKKQVLARLKKSFNPNKGN